jgi:hypothetical protein
MLKKRSFQVIMALALVAVLSSVLWFASPPANAMTITINNPSSPTSGNSTSFTVQ